MPQRREHKTMLVAGQVEERLASLEEPILAKDQWEIVCWGKI